MSCCYRHRQHQQSSSHIVDQVLGIACQVLQSFVFDATYTPLICGCWNEANVSASKITDYRSSARVWRLEISYLCSIVEQRPGDGDLDCASALCRCTGRDQTSMVWLTGVQYLHLLAVQSSLTVVRPSQAFHESMLKYRECLRFFDSSGPGRTETGSRQGVNGTRRGQAPTAMWLFTTDQYKPRKVPGTHHATYGYKCLDR